MEQVELHKQLQTSTGDRKQSLMCRMKKRRKIFCNEEHQKQRTTSDSSQLAAKLDILLKHEQVVSFIDNNGMTTEED